MIGIIGAMEEEINGIKHYIKNIETNTISNIEFYSGNINNVNVVLAKCGIGKVNASMCAEAMIMKYNPTEILHIGIAGSLKNDLKIYDCLIANKSVQYDIDLTAFGNALGQLDEFDTAFIDCDKDIVNKLENIVKSLNINYKIGIVATADKFVNNAQDKQFIADTFDADACEMEGGATNQICYKNNIKCGILRIISDSGNNEDYNKFKIDSSNKLVDIMLKYIENK